MLFLFKPYFIFIASWFFSVLFLLFAVTEVSFDNYILVVFVFLFSLSFFYVGASSSRYLKSNKIDLNGLNGGERCESYIFILLSFVFLIVCYNYYVFGPPPFLSHFGFKTLEYTVYGRFKGLLIPLLSYYKFLHEINLSKIVFLGCSIFYFSSLCFERADYNFFVSGDFFLFFYEV